MIVLTWHSTRYNAGVPPRCSKLIVMVVSTLGLLWPSTAESPAAAAPPPSPGIVHVEHELILVPARKAEPRRLPVRTATTRQAWRKPSPVPTSPPSDGIRARAGRILIGDGRYRPEPFPRPGR